LEEKAAGWRGRTGGMHAPETLLQRMPWALRRQFLEAGSDVALGQREVLFHAGDAGDGCYYLRRGTVTASVVAQDGQERLLAVLGPGSLIGELALADDAPRSATVTALRASRLLYVNKAAFFRLADANPFVYRFALRIIAGRLRNTNESVVAQGAVPVAGRVARAFLSFARGLGEKRADGGVLLPHRISQSDIAGLAGVARENASRAINDLMRAGVILRERGFYVIAQAEVLERLASV
jgi:CRP-like cAMP-binding protein